MERAELLLEDATCLPKALGHVMSADSRGRFKYSRIRSHSGAVEPEKEGLRVYRHSRQMACALGTFLLEIHVKKGYYSISGGWQRFYAFSLSIEKILVLQGPLIVCVLA